MPAKIAEHPSPTYPSLKKYASQDLENVDSLKIEGNAPEPLPFERH